MLLTFCVYSNAGISHDKNIFLWSIIGVHYSHYIPLLGKISVTNIKEIQGSCYYT